MDIKAVQEYLGKDWIAVKERINSALCSDIALLNSTNESILSHSGKQMRPMLGLLIARACSVDQVCDSTISFAAASELLHNATLLHDDVADGSVKRRGAPTIMSLMGPSVSVLVGDYWLVKAMDLIIDADGDSCVMKIFSKTLKDLAEGEMLQLQKAQKGDTDENDYLRIIYSKTASLFEAASVSAAISVGASEAYVQAARDYAVSLGIAFQIQDDILDVETLGCHLMTYLSARYPDALKQGYKLPALQEREEDENDVAYGYRLLQAGAQRRGMRISGGDFDTERMARVLLDEYRAGKLGRFTLEMPE